MIPDHEIARIAHAAVRAYRQACGESMPHEWGADSIEAREAMIGMVEAHGADYSDPASPTEVLAHAIIEAIHHIDEMERPAVPEAEAVESDAEIPEAREDG